MTVAMGELASARAPAPLNARLLSAAEHSILEAHVAFEDQPGSARAAALVSAAIASSKTLEDPNLAEAIHYLSEHSVRELQKALIASADDQHDRVSADQVRVGRLRRLLAREPRNALRWMDLALEYVKRGDTSRASRACQTATSLAPDSRFILRSASRFWQHAGDLDKARYLIDSADATEADPWLLATSVALADFDDKSSPFLKLARNMLDAADLDPWHLSELAGAIATLEWRLGSDRQARKHMRKALESPTENALAQAEWAQERGLFHEADPGEAHVPYQFEADARHSAYELQWKEAAGDADSWLRDQPFSTEAALFGSWTSSQDEDYGRAVEFCNRGRVANPKNVWLANNLAYALARGGQAADGQQWVEKGLMLHPDPRQRAYLTATQGLILFRLGEWEAGRRHYEEAISRLLAQKRRDEATMAKVILAEEEIFAGTELALRALARAEGAVRETTAHFVRARWSGLRELVEGDKISLP
jgi:Flp pilus assembly protein TadD